MARFAANGFYFDFSSIELGLLGLDRFPNELMALGFGDMITRPDVEGTGQIPLGDALGRYKCDNLTMKVTLEAYLELWNSPSLQGDGKGNKKFPVVCSLQQEGAPEFKIEWPETSLIKQPFSFQQQDASLGLTIEFKCRYMLINGSCLGQRTR